MKAYCITIDGHAESEAGYNNCVASAEKVGIDFPITKFKATVPDEVDNFLNSQRLKWNYPWDEPQLDFASGLLKTPYKTANKKARIACAISHYRLWQICAVNEEPIVVLEHDAEFINKLTDAHVGMMTDCIVGINDPRGATRLSAQYYNKIINTYEMIQNVPTIDDMKVPQGLAGNSAYVIFPRSARHMIRLVEEYGLWPNDALMCQQLVPRLKVTRTFFTRVRKMGSTTTL